MAQKDQETKADRVREYFAAHPEATSVWVDDEGGVYGTYKAKENLKKVERE